MSKAKTTGAKYDFEQMKVKVTFRRPVLGTAKMNADDYRKWVIEKKIKEATKREAHCTRTPEECEAEVDSILRAAKLYRPNNDEGSADDEFQDALTVFMRDEEGNPVMSDHQIKGFFKEAGRSLAKTDDDYAGAKEAKKKENKNFISMIDNIIFIDERFMPITLSGPITITSRSLRAQTMQGPRVSIASSETIPEGSSFEFTINLLDKNKKDLVKEWLDYGYFKGFLQWRNAGYGSFTWEEIDM